MYLYANLGYSTSANVSVPGAMNFSLAVVFSLNESFGLAIEVVSVYDFDSKQIPITALIGGVYEIVKNFFLDTGFSMGLNDYSSDWRLIFGFTVYY